MKKVLIFLPLLSSLLFPAVSLSQESADELAVQGLRSACVTLRRFEGELKMDIGAVLEKMRQAGLDDDRRIGLENIRDFKLTPLEKEIGECEAELEHMPPDEKNAEKARQGIVKELKEVQQEYLLSWRMTAEIKSSLPPSCQTER